MTRIKGWKETEFQQSLVQLEAKEILLFQKYKFGVMYVKQGQVNEDDMFSNGKHPIQNTRHALTCIKQSTQAKNLITFYNSSEQK